MDASRKEAVQRGIVHLQQRFHICTENGKVISVLSVVFSIAVFCSLHFPSSARLAYCRHRASSSYKNTDQSAVFHLVHLCVQPQHQLKINKSVHLVVICKSFHTWNPSHGIPHVGQVWCSAIILVLKVLNSLALSLAPGRFET